MMVICESYMHEFSVSKDMEKTNNDKRRKEVAIWKVAANLCLTLIIKELIISVEHDRMVTPLNIIKHFIFSVVSCHQCKTCTCRCGETATCG
jgi:hypothetical protein